MNKLKTKKTDIETTIVCSCKNKIRIRYMSEQRNCFKCGRLWVLIDGKYESTETIEKPLKRKEQKLAKQKREIVDTLACDCGNTIDMYKRHESVKCFGCNHHYDKINGKWEKAEKEDRNTMTIGNILSNVKETTKVGNITIKVRKKK